MPITFKNDNELIDYARETILAYARRSQPIFVAQFAWWLPSIVGLELRLVAHIDNLKVRSEGSCHSSKNAIRSMPTEDYTSERYWKVVKDCEQFLRAFITSREIVILYSTGKTNTRGINQLKSSRRSLRISKGKCIKEYSKTDRIDSREIDTTQSAGECLRCAWPPDRNGAYRVEDCIRPLKLHNGTARYSKAKDYLGQNLSEPSTGNSSTTKDEDRSRQEYDLRLYALLVLTKVH
jgi:hypothetical protein